MSGPHRPYRPLVLWLASTVTILVVIWSDLADSTGSGRPTLRLRRMISTPARCQPASVRERCPGDARLGQLPYRWPVNVARRAEWLAA
jgi:hypothetical protein